MNINELRNAIKALSKATDIANASKVERAPFRGYIEGLSYYQTLSQEDKNDIASDVALWYSDDAVQERTQKYTEKVFADEKEKPVDLGDKRANAKEVIAGFCKVFGHPHFSNLPDFQQEILKMMCAIHLGIIPTDGTKLNMHKGIFVAGAPQIGKTSVFVFLKQTPYFNFRLITSYKLKALCEEHGARAITEYGTRGKCLVIDEIGWEDKAVHFGNTIDAVAEVIHQRNERGLLTHMTSNMSLDTLKTRYQPHIVARIQKMCNLIEVKGATPFL